MSCTFCISSKSGLEWHFCLILMVRASHRASPDSRKEELDCTSFFFFLAALCAACGILFRNQGSAAMSAAMEVLGQWNLKHWATSVVPRLYILMEGVACAYNGERHWWWPPSETIHHTQWAENLNFGKIETKCFRADPGWRKDNFGSNTEVQHYKCSPDSTQAILISVRDWERVKIKDLIIRVHYDIARARPSCSGFWYKNYNSGQRS